MKQYISSILNTNTSLGNPKENYYMKAWTNDFKKECYVHFFRKPGAKSTIAVVSCQTPERKQEKMWPLETDQTGRYLGDYELLKIVPSSKLETQKPKLRLFTFK